MGEDYLFPKSRIPHPLEALSDAYRLCSLMRVTKLADDAEENLMPICSMGLWKTPIWPAESRNEARLRNVFMRLAECVNVDKDDRLIFGFEFHDQHEPVEWLIEIEGRFDTRVLFSAERRIVRIEQGDKWETFEIDDRQAEELTATLERFAGTESDN